MESLVAMLRVNAASPAFATAIFVTLLAGISDARWYKIPNKLTFPLIGLGVGYHALLPIGGGWLFAVAGLLFGLLILLPFFVLGGMGAGDVKLLAGIGAWVGLHDVVAVFLVFGSLAGAWSAVILLARGGRSRNPWCSLVTTLSSGQRVEDTLEEDSATGCRNVMPLAPLMAIALVVLAVGALGPWNGPVSPP